MYKYSLFRNTMKKVVKLPQFIVLLAALFLVLGVIFAKSEIVPNIDIFKNTFFSKILSFGDDDFVPEILGLESEDEAEESSSPEIENIVADVVSSEEGQEIVIAGMGFLNGASYGLVDISAGQYHTCGIDSDGNAYCWGRNQYGQLGIGSSDYNTHSVPLLVLQGDRGAGVTFTSISVGYEHTCGVGSDGKGYCWGLNTYGRLGTNNTTQYTSPKLVVVGDMTGVTFTSISAGNQHTCGVGSNGNGYCWGRNNYGQLGAYASAPPASLSLPKLVLQGARGAGVTFTSISVGYEHTCGLGSDGKGYCWGRNNYGQLGIGSSGAVSYYVPALVLQGAMGAGVTFSSISVWYQHACGVGSNGNAYCWGRNNNAQLGIGSSDSNAHSVPELVLQGAMGAGVTFTSVSAGEPYTCGIGSDGNGYCWGNNSYGQLGDGSITNSSTPVAVNYTYPAALYTNGQTNPTGVTTTVPYFSAIFNNPNSGKTGVHYQIQVNTNSSFTGTMVWNGAKTSMTATARGSRSPNINYGGTALTLNGTTYYWRIKFWDNSGIESPWSATANFTMKIYVSPSSPLNLISRYGVGEVKLYWQYPSNDGGGVTDYVIQYSNNGGGTWTTFNDGVSTNLYTTVTGLTNGHQYQFRVAAKNPAGTSGYSNITISTPQGLAITSITPTSGTYLGGGTMEIEGTGFGDYPAFSQISAGQSHTCGIGSDGNGYCWGYNYYGRLGTGDTTNYNTPKLVLQGARGAGVTFTSISAGSDHTCGLGSDDNGYCWGYNNRGQLGTGDTTDSNTPKLVLQGARGAGVTFTSISAGQQHTCGLGSDGNGYCWGYGSNGRLGTGDTTDSNTPKLVLQGERGAGVTFTSISAGVNHTCGLGSDGKGYCWGYNNRGQLGIGDTTSYNTPKKVLQGDMTGITFASISLGSQHTCGLGSDGNGYCWGSNGNGRLGTGTSDYNAHSVPELVLQGARGAGVIFTSVSVGSQHTCGLGSDCNGYCWGGNSNGQLGVGTSDSNAHSTPAVVGGTVFNINFGDLLYQNVAVAVGDTSIVISPIPSYAIGIINISITRTSDNVTSNTLTYTYTNLPPPDIISITPSITGKGGGESLSISGTGFLDYGPMKLTSISAGQSHTCGVGSDGNGYCWGLSGFGQLGTGDTTSYNTPKLVLQGARGAGVTFTSISAGANHTCGIGSDGNGYCWGANWYGQLGVGTSDYNEHSVPELVLQGARGAGVTFTSISAGQFHTCGLGSDGNGYCWGNSGVGQLGTGDATDSYTPKKVLQGARGAGVTFTSISAGQQHTCGLGSDGKGYCWGSNGNGQLGVGTSDYNTHYVPELVLQGDRGAGVTFTSISASTNHTCGVGSNGNGYCWGDNYYGKLGTGDTTNYYTPKLVLQGDRGAGITFTSISAGSEYTCGVGSNGNGYCWGYNQYGRLGTGNTTDSNTPKLLFDVALPSSGTLESISAGSDHACGVGSDGSGYCWGNNSYGQLGTNDTIDRLTMTYVLHLNTKPSILFGSTLAPSTTYNSTTSMNATTPSFSSGGTVTVKLTNPDGQYDTYDIFVGSTPSAPLNLISRYGVGEVKLYWQYPADDGGSVTDYIVQYSSNGGSTWTTFNDGVSTNLYTTVTGLTNGHQYQFRVAAKNPAGTSGYSNITISTPQGLAITSITPNSGLYFGGGNMTIEGTGFGDSPAFSQISAGQFHTCGLGSDGNGYCWGDSGSGKLGTGDTTQYTSPKLVLQGDRGAGVTFTSISAGQYHTCGIGSDGNGYCWGSNGNGQLGVGTSDYNTHSVPELVLQGDRGAGVTFTSISAGQSHTCGIGSDGNGYCWGYNQYGRLGTNNTTQYNSPKLVVVGDMTGVTFTSISAGSQHTCGVGSNGNGYCWGYNQYGRLGTNNTTQYNYPKLVVVGDMTGVTFTSISAGDTHTCGVGSNGKGYCWGNNQYGRLGTNNTTQYNYPKLVVVGDMTGVTFTSISAGMYLHTCGQGSNGKGYCWGYNNYGQLGTGNTTQYSYPKLVVVGDMTGVTFTSISAGQYHTCGLGSDANGYCWGNNQDGRLGTGTSDSNAHSTPAIVGGTVFNINFGDLLYQNVAVAVGGTSIAISPIPSYAIGIINISITRTSDNVTSNTLTYTYTNLPSPDITNITPSITGKGGGESLGISGTGFLDYGPVKLTSISVGDGHTCGLGSDGNGYCWGDNGNGQLGTGDTTSYNTPKKVLQGARGAGVTFTSISVGNYHTCGVGSDGNGYCWGANWNGQLGVGTSDYNAHSVPELVLQGARGAGVTFTSISVGPQHTCGISSDAKGYCWGANWYGQLGTGDTTGYYTPKLVLQGDRGAGVTFTSISVGSQHTCGVGSDGNGYCWGYNGSGGLGTGNTTDSNIPKKVVQGERGAGVTFTSISVGGEDTCGLGSDGNGYCWGYNGNGQLGTGDTTSYNIPKLILQGDRGAGVTFTSISAGNQHTCGLGSNGSGYCWGYNQYGRLGTGNTTQYTSPKKVFDAAIPSSETLESISAGGNHTCGLGSDGKGYCWGYNSYGQLGTNDTINRLTMTYIFRMGNSSYVPASLSVISAGSSHSCGLDSDGNGYCWGYNSYGQLGTGDTTNYNTPKLVLQGDMTGVTFTSISAWNGHTCGLGSDGNGYCWGGNWYGQLGTGDTTDSNTPKLVLQGDRGAGVTFTSISAGNQHTCGLGSDGNGYCWGYGSNGRLGTGDTTDSNTPKLVLQGERGAGVTFTSISAGYSHTCGVGSNGNGYCWGDNEVGQLGTGGGTDYYTPKLVSQGDMTGVTFTSISVGSEYTCGLGSDGNGYCWGPNGYGQLGTGDTTQYTSPKLVLQGDRGAGVTFTSISAGGTHTCGLGSDNNGYCWGPNWYGQLGTGDDTEYNTPKKVLQGDMTGVTVTSISAGGEHTCGLGSDGNGYCWGYNYYGQLGIGTSDEDAHSTPELFSALQEVFVSAIKIEFGSILAANTTYNSSTSMNATTPVFPSYGIVIVKLTNPDGQYDTYEILVANPPSAPLNLSAIAGNTKVTLSWDAPSDNGGQTITDYLIQYSSNGGSTWTTLPHTPSVNTVAVITNLTNNTEYIFRVAAINTIGTGPYSTIASATPFNANPTFTGITNTSPANPGGSITWNATASDDVGVRLLVCKTASITNGVCSNGAWCTSSTVSSNPSCTYNIPDPSPAGIFNAYVYVLDAENLQATPPLQGSNSPFTISGVAPMINTVRINEGSAIELIGASTKDIEVTATVTSHNSCQSIDTVKAYLYRSGIGYSNCNESEDSDANNCYPEITCVQDSGTCTDATDFSADYTCSVDMEYYADPTDINTEFSAQNWLATVKATDINTLSSTQEITTGVELNSLISFSIVESSLTYGTLLAGFSNPTLSETITSIPTGNVGLDQKHSGDSKGMCANYPTCTAPSAIPLTNQRYSITSSTPFANGTQLSSTPAVVDINIPKMRGTIPSKLSYWGIYVPLGTLPGGYEGKNFIDAVKGEVANW